MKKLMTSLVAITFLLILGSISAAKTNDTLPTTKEITSGLDQLLAQERGRGTVGIFVQSLRTGKVIYAKNADVLFSPASSMKVVTAFAALRFLGPNYKFHTEILTDAVNPAGPNLTGNLYVKFSGDPDLSMQDLNSLFVSLANSGIRNINGKVFIDHSEFDNNGIAPGTVIKDTRYCYGAPIEATMLNHNCVAFTAMPGLSIGSPARLEFPNGIALPIVNASVTKNAKHCALKLQNTVSGEYQLSGCVAPKTHQYIMVPLLNSNSLGATAVRSLLKQNGISITANTIVNTNSNMQILAVHESPPLSELVTDMLKHSDNIIASSLYKKIGATYFKQPGSWENGSKAIKAILSGHDGIDLSRMQMLDGSGLSRYDMITPTQLVQVLRAAYTDPQLANVFVNALPVDGIDGTLKHRMLTKDMIGQVKAKTGSMHDITSLAGYLETAKHDTLVFAIVVNDMAGMVWRFRALQDRICHYLHLRA